MRLTARRAARSTALIVLASVAIILGGHGNATADSQTQDGITSDNVEFLKSIRSPSGLTAGAKLIGKYLYVTSAKDLQIFDVSQDPANPVMVGSITADIQFENEEVPTNGKLLGISSQYLHLDPECLAAAPKGLPVLGGCLDLYDVRDPANVKKLTPVPGAGDHTSTCVLDCSYFYGSAGTITDASHVFDTPSKPAKIIGNWQDAVKKQGVKFTANCHNQNEFKPGYIITACNPILVLSVLPQDGGSILNPKVLATGTTPSEVTRFIHSARWPRQGQDKFALIGGETNFQPQCHPTVGAFMTFDATHALTDGSLGTPLDELRPINGFYLDSNPPAQVLGCSVHWYEEHSTFRNGGLVALAEYENGTRFLQIKPDGKIVEQGFFIPLGGSTSAPHWAPNSDILYAVDYERGLDVLRWKGQHYVPDDQGNVIVEPGRVPGTEGRQPQPPAGVAVGSGAAVCATDAGFKSATVRPHNTHGGHASDEAGAGPGLAFSVARRLSRPFSVDVFQVSQGRRIVHERRVARFTGRKASFDWSGRGAHDGYYFVRFSMALPNGKRDIRRSTLRRRQGRFSTRPQFYARDTCGALRSFKLERPVFGGTTRRPLRIAYRLTRGVDSVKVQALVKGRVIATFDNTGNEARTTYRVSLAAAKVPRGADVKIRLRLVRANARVTSTLTSRRL